MTTDDELDPIEPSTAKEMYLNDRRHELSDASIQGHHYRLKQFVQWCDEVGIDNLNNLSGRDIHRFRVKRRDEDDIATATLRSQMATLRVFFRFCTTIQALPNGFDEKIVLPTTTAEDAREELLDPSTAEQVLDYLDQYRYATLEHALFEVLWHTGLRVGATIGLDQQDYSKKNQFLSLVHRPETGTSLKNRTQSERLVAISERVCQVLDDYLEVNHPQITDDHGRDPLFASQSGRLSQTHARRIAYQYTRPCVYANSCPHDREIDDCEAASYERPYACPSSLSPHPIRRGSITHYLRNDTPEKVVSDRMDVGEDTLNRHYDQRSQRDKLRQRRQYLPDE